MHKKVFKILTSGKMLNSYYFAGLIIAITTGFLRRTFFAEYIESYLLYLYLLSWMFVGLRELIKIAKKEYELKHWFVAAASLLIILVLIKANKSAVELATFIPFAFSGRDIEFRKTAKAFVCLETVLLITVSICAFCSVIQNYKSVLVNEMGVLTGKYIIYFLGFLYKLFPCSFFFAILLMVLYLKKDSLTAVDATLLFLANIVVFLLTSGKLVFLLGAGVIAFAVIYSIVLPAGIKDSKILHWFGYLWSMIFIILGVASFVVSYYYNPEKPWMAKLNGLSEGRILLTKNGFTTFGVTLLGQGTDMAGAGLSYTGTSTIKTTYNWVDNAWMNVLFRNGVLVLIVLVLLYTLLMLCLNKLKQYYIMSLLTFVAVQMLIDDCNLIYYWNGFMLMFAVLLAKDKESFLSTASKELNNYKQ